MPTSLKEAHIISYNSTVFHQTHIMRHHWDLHFPPVVLSMGCKWKLANLSDTTGFYILEYSIAVGMLSMYRLNREVFAHYFLGEIVVTSKKHPLWEIKTIFFLRPRRFLKLFYSYTNTTYPQGFTNGQDSCTNMCLATSLLYFSTCFILFTEIVRSVGRFKPTKYCFVENKDPCGSSAVPKLWTETNISKTGPLHDYYTYVGYESTALGPRACTWSCWGRRISCSSRWCCRCFCACVICKKKKRTRWTFWISDIRERERERERGERENFLRL